MPDFKFHKHYRLSKENDISNVFNNGKSVSDNNFVVYARQNNLDFSRICIIASKKYSLSAVKRNKIRRMAREYFRLNHKKFPVSFDLIIIPRKNSAVRNYSETVKSLDKLIFLKGLLKNGI
ncbi:ribonuclease P protein component [Candidatus Dependentiae bacterium]|nr:ribonuclease P protein component [Candidatus Dependentiae bacterium]